MFCHRRIGLVDHGCRALRTSSKTAVYSSHGSERCANRDDTCQFVVSTVNQFRYRVVTVGGCGNVWFIYAVGSVVGVVEMSRVEERVGSS